MGKTCCFIGTIDDRHWYEDSTLSPCLSAFLFHLVFVNGVTRFLFPYGENLRFLANELLEPIRCVEPSVKRVLLCFKQEHLDIPFAFFSRHKFEETVMVDDAFTKREELFRKAIEESELCIFHLDDGSSAQEENAREYAISREKTVVDFDLKKNFHRLFF